MKKTAIVLLVAILLTFALTLTGCDLFSGLFGNKTGDSAGDADTYETELPSSTGKWILMDDNTTYFTFNGAKGEMTFTYVEGGESKFDGTFRVVDHGFGSDVMTPISFILTRNDKSKEDWIGCYVEDFKTDFTQFTILSQEEDLGMTDGTIYTHVYRISELPYKMGTYILEGKAFKTESNTYNGSDNLHIPAGTYTLPSGESFTFLMTKPRDYELFQYRNGDTVIEGTFWMAQDKKTIYLYITHDPYTKVKNADKDHYDTTFDINYPPDIYLRGDFSKSGSFVINGLYHHTESTFDVADTIWTYGEYTKQ
ncbi:MAG: hypothetical protein IKB54_01140 [Clostridia bacterium]|nr:hypothetical protein [Clostridia bacterium]